MQHLPTPHLEKLNATLENSKLPKEDIPRIELAIKRYKEWVVELSAVDEDKNTEEIVQEMVMLLNQYRSFLDLEIIFDSDNDFLYRQKGQIKLDNSVIEEFLPHLIQKCVLSDVHDDSIFLGPKKAFSSLYFTSTLDDAMVSGGIHVRTKDQDFTVARRVYMKTSYSPKFEQYESKNFYIAYVAAECKTNLDKTMFQEASATANDVKSSLKGSKYYLLCEWLDMTPQSTAATSIDEVLILRRAKRMNSNIRSKFGKALGRKSNRQSYVDFLNNSPFDVSVFERLVTLISGLVSIEDPIEDDVLKRGYF
ncbi:MAG TPA: Bpu10I family restriction endonuclease [Planctomycetaceae bacterium]|nr:restriction endonuclease [Rubinisphaera sp.]HCS50111.1 Bpu10I family restriction endonuclease [Planctomycetaceae bacterium]